MAALCLLAALALPSLAAGQTFTLQAGPLSPDAVQPGGSSSSNITVGTQNGFSGSVNLGCQVTTTAQDAANPPVCSISPATVNVPGSASATITTTGGTDPTTTVSYDIVITGTAPSTEQVITLAPLSLTVLAVTPQFTVTVDRPIAPSSVPAGNGGEGFIDIAPVNDYTTPASGGITLSCSTVTPLVTIPPVCSFSPAVVELTGQSFVQSEITISTFGNETTTAMTHPGQFKPMFYGAWMPLPLLAIVGLGAAVGGKRSRKAWGLLALFLILGGLFLMPACGNTTNTKTAPNGVTPANTYTFTITGVDGDGNIASNTGSTTGANPSVSLTVTAPTQ